MLRFGASPVRIAALENRPFPPSSSFLVTHNRLRFARAGLSLGTEFVAEGLASRHEARFWNHRDLAPGWNGFLECVGR